MERTEAASALALDLGSSSARAILGSLRDGVLVTQEVHRLTHRAQMRQGSLCWDIEALNSAVADGLDAARQALGTHPASIGIDTWGVDYGLLDHDGALLRPPRAYRDARMARHSAALEGRIDRAGAWQATGVLPMEINTSYQVFADLQEEPGLAQRVGALLPLPDLLAHELGAPVGVGRAIASTTGLAAPGARQWSPVMAQAIDLPESWLAPLVDDAVVSGSIAGTGTAIVRPGGHDTACAVHSLGLAPHQTALFISCGSWSLIGATVPEPIVEPGVLEAGLSNEVRTDGGVRLLRNLTGLWLLQECQRAWGEDDVAGLVEAAGRARSLGVVVDPDDPAFMAPGDMPAALGEWCQEHYGIEPSGRAQMVRLILESLACAHAEHAERLAGLVGSALAPGAPIHLVGGGARNRLLAQMTATACQRPVVIGAVEASAMGNLLAQFEATGAARPQDRDAIVRQSCQRAVLEPEDPSAFTDMRERLARARIR
ncbi:rhamnulokinase family protein [Actinomyces slackii]|uniref:Rhamnulokinase n=1 Tax=Actinomyces slackii TaxID=52774 RepID=A0A3S4UNI4_9ACTO|nr:FGGY-family carbohydrate kinase [Actinomyces slackii]VEG74629.1 Rhamnulokinase [Actinomyces slackii]